MFLLIIVFYSLFSFFISSIIKEYLFHFFSDRDKRIRTEASGAGDAGVGWSSDEDDEGFVSKVFLKQTVKMLKKEHTRDITALKEDFRAKLDTMFRVICQLMEANEELQAQLERHDKFANFRQSVRGFWTRLRRRHNAAGEDAGEDATDTA